MKAQGVREQNVVSSPPPKPFKTHPGLKGPAKTKLFKLIPVDTVGTLLNLSFFIISLHAETFMAH